MPLNPNALRDDLETLFTDPPVTSTSDGAIDYVTSRDDCAALWADAMMAYSVAIVPASTTVASAGVALRAQLAATFATGTAAVGVDTALIAFAAAVGSGMAPAFIAAPPTAPPGFADNIGTIQPSHAVAADFWAATIDAWMRTGTATPSGGGAPVVWS